MRFSKASIVLVSGVCLLGCLSGCLMLKSDHLAARAEWGEQLEDAEGKLADAQRDLDSAKAALNDANNAHGKKVTILDGTIASAAAENKLLNGQIVDLKGQLAAAEKKLTSAREEAKSLAQSEKAARKDSIDLKRKLEAKDGEIAELKLLVGRLQARLVELEAKIKKPTPKPVNP